MNFLVNDYICLKIHAYFAKSLRLVKIRSKQCSLFAPIKICLRWVKKMLPFLGLRVEYVTRNAKEWLWFLLIVVPPSRYCVRLTWLDWRFLPRYVIYRKVIIIVGLWVYGWISLWFLICASGSWIYPIYNFESSLTNVIVAYFILRTTRRRWSICSANTRTRSSSCWGTRATGSSWTWTSEVPPR